MNATLALGPLHVALLRLGVAAGLFVLGGCSYLDEPAGAAATSVRAAATQVPTRIVSSPTPGRTPTRPPLATRTPTPEPADESDIEQSVADARASIERVLASASLPGIENLLVETVALAAPSGGEQLPRAAAARWLRQRGTGRIQIVDFQRHQHQALIIASTQGWRAVSPLTTNQLGFTLRRYDPAGAQDPDHGDWLIDVFEAE